MLAYKFLDGRRRSIHTGTAWQPGEWVDSGQVDTCRSGIHACEAADLAHWLGSEMWVIELDGATVFGQHKVAARRGRLLHPVDEYPNAVRELGELGAWATRELAMTALRAAGKDDAADRFAGAASIAELRALRRPSFEELDQDAPWGALAMLAADVAALLTEGEPAESPFIACCAAGVAATIGNPSRAAYGDAYDENRRAQSAWLTHRLSLV